MDAMVNEGGAPPPRAGGDATAARPTESEPAGIPIRDWPRHKARSALRSLGQRYLDLLIGRHHTFRQTLKLVPDRMHRAARQTHLMLEAVEDFHSGAYRDIPWGAVAVMAGALLYAVNPADVVPDALPFLGALDDIAVVTVAVRLVQSHLQRYCRHKGYAVTDYF